VGTLGTLTWCSRRRMLVVLLPLILAARGLASGCGCAAVNSTAIVVNVAGLGYRRGRALRALLVVVDCQPRCQWPPCQGMRR